ncbi:MAG: hypothetical protein ACUVUT_01155 [Candidatus Bipolaricaulia bacterium]
MVSLFEIGAGARPLGLGGAFTALADDENALFYNPAGLGFLEQLRFGSFYEPRFGASFGDLALAGQRFGFGLLFFNLGLEKRDANDAALGTFTYGSTGLVGAGGVSLADLPFRQIKLPENLALGLGLKLYQVSALEGGSGSGLALDLGLLFSQGLTLGGLPIGLRLGAKLENLGLPVEYGTGYTETWPLGLRLGTAATVRDLTVALDLETRGLLHLGAEYRFTKIGLERFGLGTLALRVGGFTQGQGGLVLTLGFGLQFKNFYLDYAFITYPQAADAHRLAFAAEFKLPRLF